MRYAERVAAKDKMISITTLDFQPRSNSQNQRSAFLPNGIEIVKEYDRFNNFRLRQIVYPANQQGSNGRQIFDCSEGYDLLVIELNGLGVENK